MGSTRLLTDAGELITGIRMPGLIMTNPGLLAVGTKKIAIFSML